MVAVETSASPYDVSRDHYKVYARRWYVLIIFSLVSYSQSNIWITYGAVSDTATAYYNVPMSNINYITSMGPVGFFLFSFASTWFISKFGLRWSTIAAAGCVMVGGVLRCFATSGTFWIVLLAQFVNACAGPIVMVVPPALSVAWFGVNERTFATAITTMANYMGSSFGFLLGLPVHDGTTLRYLLYSEGLLSVVLFVAIVLYFPAVPPTPPTPAAANLLSKPHVRLLESWRVMFRDSWKVLTNFGGLMLVLSGSLVSGVIGAWGGMVVSILNDNYSQSQTQWIGFANILVGVAGGLILGKVHDRFHNYKLILCLSYGLSGVLFLLFNWFESKSYLIAFGLATLCGLIVNSPYPVAFEAIVEKTFPVLEEVSGNLFALGNNIFCFALLIVGNYEQGSFINYVVAGCCFAALAMILLIKEEYLRSDSDIATEVYEGVINDDERQALLKGRHVA